MLITLSCRKSLDITQDGKKKYEIKNIIILSAYELCFAVAVTSTIDFMRHNEWIASWGLYFIYTD